MPKSECITRSSSEAQSCYLSRAPKGLILWYYWSQMIGEDITIHPERLCPDTGCTKPRTLTSRWRRTVRLSEDTHCLKQRCLIWLSQRGFPTRGSRGFCLDPNTATRCSDCASKSPPSPRLNPTDPRGNHLIFSAVRRRRPQQPRHPEI